MNTVTVSVSTIPTVDAYLDKYLKDRIGDQKGFRLLKASGDYEKPGEREQLILLSFCQNGTHQKFVDETIVKAGNARTTDIAEEFKKYSVVIQKDVQQTPALPDAPAKAEEKVAVVEPKKESRGQKRLQTEIRSEFFRMIGTKESASTNIFRAAIKHFDDNLKDVANMVATVAEIDVAEKDHLIEFSVKSVFGKIFGAMPNIENITKPILASSPLLVHRYEAVLFKDGGTSSDSAIKNEFKSKVINAAAAKIAEALEEPIADVIEELKPIFEESLENIKKEFSTES